MSVFNIIQMVPLLLLVLVFVPQTDSSVNIGVNKNVVKRSKRHTPFMPEDHWKGAPEFGGTQTNLTVMVNGTVDIRCPIGHVMDSAVS